MDPRSSINRTKLSLVLVIGTAACGGGGGQHPTLVSIAIAPAGPSMAKGLTKSFTATGTLTDGTTQDVSAIATWTSSNVAVATVTGSGMATAQAVGNSTIAASVAAGTSLNAGSTPVTGSTVLTVTAATLVSVAVTPANSALELGDNQAFTAAGTFTDHTTLDLTQMAIWSSSDVTVLRLNNSPGRMGVGNTRGPGIATVSASTGGLEGSTTATVTRRTPRFLYASNLGASSVSAFSVDSATGGLTPVGIPVATTAGATSIAVTRDFRFLYSADFASDKLSWFSIEADGSLTPAGAPLPIANAPLGVIAHPTKDVLYVSTQGSGITIVTVDPTSGAPSITGSVALGNAPQFGAISPDGELFYQTLSAADQVAGFSVDAGGALTTLDGGLTTTAHFPRAVAVDPAGKFLYVVIVNPVDPPTSSVVEGYTIDPGSGALAKITGSPFDAGVDPVFPAIDPSGRFLFVAGYLSRLVSAWTIDPETGVLTPAAGSPFGLTASPFFVTVEPSGRYLYVGAGSADADAGIRGFTIDQSTGALTPNPAATAPGTNVWSIAVTH